MNRGELRQYVLTNLDDLNAGYFKPEYVNLRLNLALYEVQRYLVNNGQSWYTICAETTLVVNQQEYVLPEDFLILNRLDLIISGTPPNETLSPLEPITIMQQDFVTNLTGNPAFYFFKKNRIKIFPAPNSPLQLRLLYSYRVGQMTNDADIPDVPEQYQEMIGIFAVIDGLLRDGRDPAAFMAKKEEFKMDVKASAAQRHVDQSRRIVETGSYDSGIYW